MITSKEKKKSTFISVENKRTKKKKKRVYVQHEKTNTRMEERVTSRRIR